MRRDGRPSRFLAPDGMPTTAPSETQLLARRAANLDPQGRSADTRLAVGLAVFCVPPAAMGGETGVDQDLRPGDDFFAWANGAWLADDADSPGQRARRPPAPRSPSGPAGQIARLLEDANTAPAGSLARRVADFRTACLDEAEVERRGLEVLAPRLAAIAEVADRAALSRLLGARMRADVDPLNRGVYDSASLLGLAVEMGNNGEPNYLAFLLQGGLGLSDRDLYLGDEAPLLALRSRYQEYIGRLLALAGFEHEPAASTRAAAVLALETAIARSHATRAESANDRNAGHLWTRADFTRRAPGVDWPAFLAAAGLSSQPDFVVWQPSAIVGAATLVATQPLAAWQDYLRFHELHRHADLLPKALAEAALAMRTATVEATGGEFRQISRAERAQATTLLVLGDEVGRLYTERYFPPASKTRVEAIVGDVVAAFRRRLAAATWMTPASRTIALRKLERLYFGVGYPDRRGAGAELAVDPADAIGNLERVAARDYRNALARLGSPVDRTRWAMTPQTAGAVLLFQQNAYNFPAALLQAPKFDPTASDAENYGSIGAIVGHEVSHFVDTLGAEYDSDGANRRWWTPADVAGYRAATTPLVEQYSAYRPFPDLAVDAERTLTENLADLGGLVAAFDAYRSSLGESAADPALVRRLDREFFIGFARSWRSKVHPEALRQQMTGAGPHAPDAYRIASVRNLDAWYEAFDVRPGDRLYLPPERRVRIW
jgi:putative endopeptidase